MVDILYEMTQLRNVQSKMKWPYDETLRKVTREKDLLIFSFYRKRSGKTSKTRAKEWRCRTGKTRKIVAEGYDQLCQNRKIVEKTEVREKLLTIG